MNTGQGGMTSETHADTSAEATQMYEQQVSQGEARVRESKERTALGVNGLGEELEIQVGRRKMKRFRERRDYASRRKLCTAL